jgi:molybdate transport system substrate-binding protein
MIRIIVVATTMLVWPAWAHAQLNVMISGGFSGAYNKLLPEFERANGLQVTTGSGASQGSGPQTIAAQLARGVPADVVILSREGLTELLEQSRIAAGTDVDLAQVGMGVAVRAGTPKPDIGSVEAFKRVLANSRTTGASTSGTWVIKELFPRLGIADKGQFKLVARGAQASGSVAAGDADLALLPVSELQNVLGVDYAGAFPAELQFMQTFSAAIVRGSKQADAGRRLIAFLASEHASSVIRHAGMEPLGKRRAQ